MSNSKMPSLEIRDELEEALKSRDDVKEYSYYANYSYRNGSWSAVVTFSHSKFPPLNAMYERKEDRSTGRHYWYCTRDWND